jgi:hypothetical protein
MTDIVVRSAIVGAVAGFATSVLFPSSETVPFMGMELSQAVGVGVAVGGASAVGSIAGRNLLPLLPQSEAMATSESKLLNPALTGAATYAMARVFMGDVPNPVPLILMGAGSEVAGSYAFETIKPMMMAEKGGDVGGMPASGF